MERVLVGGGGRGVAIWVTWSVVWSRPVGACRAVICPVGGLVALVTSVALARTGCAAERAGGGGCGMGKQERGAGVPWVFLLWCGTRGAAGARVAFA